MAKLFGIPIDDRDKEKKRDEASNDGDNHLRDEEADIDLELLENAIVHVDDAHDDEQVTVYDKEDPVIEVGRMFPSMDGFRMCSGHMQSNVSLLPRLCGLIKKDLCKMHRL